MITSILKIDYLEIVERKSSNTDITISVRNYRDMSITNIILDLQNDRVVLLEFTIDDCKITEISLESFEKIVENIRKEMKEIYRSL